MSIRIGHGNAHNEAAFVDWVRDAGADSFGGNEVQTLLPKLRAIPGTRLTVACPDYREDKDPSGADDRHQSTAIVTDSDRTNIGQFARQVSERVPGVERIAPDRVLVCSMFQHPVATRLGKEGVAHFELHPDATVRDRDEDHPLVREYREALISARTWMGAAKRDGLLLILTGDLQVPKGFDRPFGPQAMLEHLVHEAFVVHIDHLWLDPLLRVENVKTKKLHDHTGFVADIVPA